MSIYWSPYTHTISKVHILSWLRTALLINGCGSVPTNMAKCQREAVQTGALQASIETQYGWFIEMSNSHIFMIQNEQTQDAWKTAQKYELIQLEIFYIIIAHAAFMSLKSRAVGQKVWNIHQVRSKIYVIYQMCTILSLSTHHIWAAAVSSDFFFLSLHFCKDLFTPGFSVDTSKLCEAQHSASATICVVTFKLIVDLKPDKIYL